MTNFIEGFYYGNLDPQARSTKCSETVTKEIIIIAAAEEYLISKLQGEEKSKFLEHINAWSILNGETNLDSFIIAGEDKPERKPIGKFGQRHLRYIKKHCKPFYNKMQNDDKLYEYLIQLNQDAEEMFNTPIEQFKKLEGITEQLKAQDQMQWVSRMNNIRHRATEIVNNELIYT